jgi:hypothetical protein
LKREKQKSFKKDAEKDNGPSKMNIMISLHSFKSIVRDAKGKKREAKKKKKDEGWSEIKRNMILKSTGVDMKFHKFLFSSSNIM